VGIFPAKQKAASKAAQSTVRRSKGSELFGFAMPTSLPFAQCRQDDEYHQPDESGDHSELDDEDQRSDERDQLSHEGDQKQYKR
jgi:hypothetical protein